MLGCTDYMHVRVVSKGPLDKKSPNYSCITLLEERVLGGNFLTWYIVLHIQIPVSFSFPICLVYGVVATFSSFQPQFCCSECSGTSELPPSSPALLVVVQ